MYLPEAGEVSSLILSCYKLAFSFSEPCALPLDLFIDELKKLQMLHDPTCSVPHASEVDTTKRLAMP